MDAGFLGNSYFAVKAAHLIFVLFWMAGLFMLPRFFAYHVEDISETGVGSAIDLRWRDRERRLMHIIINPSMIVLWVLGLLLAFHGDLWHQPWFLAKFALVVLLSGLHGWLSRWRKAFARGENVHGSRFFRLVNEIPTLASIPIVLLVIIQPWS